jgi:hypothetical protein
MSSALAVLSSSTRLFENRRDSARGTVLIAAPRSSTQNLEYDGCGPTKQEYAVHRRYWPEQSVTVTERRVVHESEVYWVRDGGQLPESTVAVLSLESGYFRTWIREVRSSIDSRRSFMRLWQYAL